MRRRDLIRATAAVALLIWRRGLLAPAEAGTASGTFPVAHTDAEWHQLLTHQQYAVLRDHATEKPNSSPLEFETRKGVFACAGCDQPVFRSEDKFDSGTGWPSFSRPIDGAIGTAPDRWLLVLVRTEVHCSRCGGHLGHVFDDGPPPTGKRYCMNGVAMVFHPSQSPVRVGDTISPAGAGSPAGSPRK
jgi:peptide-methionine (R)-S-oxide reductase